MSIRSRIRKPSARPTPARSLRRPGFDTLESRAVPTVFTVTRLLNDGGPGTLRDAVD